MSNSSVSFDPRGQTMRPGDALYQVCTMGGPAIITRINGTTITYRAWRWYDGPRLWLRALWRRVVG